VGGQQWALFKSGQGTSSPVHYLFDLATGGEYVRLSQNDDTTTAVDAVSFGLASPSPASQGRLPDGTANLVSLHATPGMPNSAAPGPVLFAQQPSTAAPAGKPFTLSIGTNGTSGQWYRNGQPLPGQTGSSLSLTSLTSADDGDYTFASTNADGTLTSRPARLTVLYTYAAWAAEKGIGAMTADADNDGLSNGHEFLAGTNPLIPASPAERLARHLAGGSETIGGVPYLTMDFTLSRRAAFSTLTGESSTALTPWAAAVPDLIQVLSTDPNGDQRLRYKFASPIPRRFLRLQVVE
jgi:hypothetical protein